jgi:hypothetical protein
MAIVAMDRVAMTVTVGGAAPPKLLGLAGVPPMFGTVDAAGLNVLWRNGTFSLAIAATALDKITDPDADVANDFIGKRVKVTSPTGYTNWGLLICIDAYKRDYNGAGAAIQVLLLQSPSGEYFVEALSSNCEVVN